MSDTEWSGLFVPDVITAETKTVSLHLNADYVISGSSDNAQIIQWKKIDWIWNLTHNILM